MKWVWFVLSICQDNYTDIKLNYAATMAGRPKVVEEALRKITAQLECSICLDTLTDAKLLPCFHSFCKKCLERLVVQDRDGHTLYCPTCRRTTLLPPTGVSGLQTDFHAEHLFELSHPFHSHSAVYHPA